MIQLSNASDKAVRAQVAESISLIAKVDFPEQWPDLVDVSTIAIIGPCLYALVHDEACARYLIWDTCGS